MFRGHFGLNADPFALSPNLKFLYMSKALEETMAHLAYGLEEGEDYILITGAIGTGKTIALHNLMAQVSSTFRTVLINTTQLNFRELLKMVCNDLKLDIPTGADKADLFSALKEYLQQIRHEGDKLLLIIDEAQNLSVDTLEGVRLLTNLAQPGGQCLQIVLAGQPGLEIKIKQPDLAQLRQRIRIHYCLETLDRQDLENYISHRLKIAGCQVPLFKSDALDKIYYASSGVPRLVNILGSRALLAAFVSDAKLVEGHHVEIDDTTMLTVTSPEVAMEAPKPMPSMAPAPAPEMRPVQQAAPIAAPLQAEPVEIEPPAPPRSEPSPPPPVEPPEVKPAPVAAPPPVEPPEVQPAPVAAPPPVEPPEVKPAPAAAPPPVEPPEVKPEPVAAPPPVEPPEVKPAPAAAPPPVEPPEWQPAASPDPARSQQMAAQSSRRPAESPGKEPAALEPSDGPDQLAVEDDLTVGPDFYETSRRYPQRPRSRRRLLLAAAAVVVVIASLAVAWPYLSSGIGKGLRNQPLNQENKHAPGESATALQDQVPATADVQGGDMTPDGSAEPLPGGSDAGSVPAGASNQEGTAGGDLTDGEEAREQVQSTASTSDEGTGAIESTTEREVAALAVATADPPQTRSSGNPSSSTPSQSETRGSGQAVAREVELPIDRPDDAQRVAPSDSPPPPPPSSGFGVHVASFGELARAEAFISRLNKLGYPAFFLKKVIGNETWNRVYVGPFMERQQAQRYSRNLQEQGLAEYYLVTKFGDG